MKILKFRPHRAGQFVLTLRCERHKIGDRSIYHFETRMTSKVYWTAQFKCSFIPISHVTLIQNHHTPDPSLVEIKKYLQLKFCQSNSVQEKTKRNFHSFLSHSAVCSILIQSHKCFVVFFFASSFEYLINSVVFSKWWHHFFLLLSFSLFGKNIQIFGVYREKKHCHQLSPEKQKK